MMTVADALDIATRRLSVMANQYGIELADLLEWYSAPEDMEAIATWQRTLIEQSVRFYINHSNQVNP